MLTLTNVSFSYNQKEVLENISLQIPSGTIVALLGESGCGKSTLLKLIYGLLDGLGEIYWNEQQVLGPKFNLVPGMETMKYLAQDFGLMPYITVAENVGKHLSNFYLEEKQARIQELLEVVGMLHYASTKVQYLSGGEMQRVALAKCLALQPQLLLLDEPFSHIDNSRKNNLRRTLFQYIAKEKITCLVATHDVQDVLPFCSQTIVLRNGRVWANKPTIQLYHTPENAYTAALLDDVNEISGKYWGVSDILYLYPYQLQVVDYSNLKVKVLHSYFKGRNYLIQGEYPEGYIYFEHPVMLSVGSWVYINRV